VAGASTPNLTDALAFDAGRAQSGLLKAELLGRYTKVDSRVCRRIDADWTAAQAYLGFVRTMSTSLEVQTVPTQVPKVPTAAQLSLIGDCALISTDGHNVALEAADGGPLSDFAFIRVPDQGDASYTFVWEALTDLAPDNARALSEYANIDIGALAPWCSQAGNCWSKGGALGKDLTEPAVTNVALAAGQKLVVIANEGTSPTRAELEPISTELELMATGAGALGSLATSAVSSLGDTIDQNAIIVGLSDFLVERARVELGAWLVETRLKELCTPSTGKLSPGVVLPETCDMVMVDPLFIAFAAQSTLIHTARTDMTSAPRHMSEWFAEFDADPSARDVARVAAVQGRVMELGLDGTDPLTALALWARSTSSDDENTKGSLKWLLNQGPASTADPKHESNRLTAALFASSVVLNAFPLQDGQLQLPGQALTPDDIALIVGASLVNLAVYGVTLDFTDENGQPLQFVSFEGLPEAVTEFITGVLGEDGTLVGLREAVEQLETVGDDPEAKLGVLSEILAYGGEIAAEALDIASALPTGSMNATDVSSQLEKAKKVATNVATVASKVALADYGGAIVELTSIATDVVSNVDKLPQNFKRSLVFTSALAESASSEDAKRAIEAWAAPPGSWRNKRGNSGSWYWGVNSYVGLGVGWEYGGTEDSDFSTGAFTTAPNVTLGLEGGRGFAKKWYFGAYIPMLDLGAVAAVRYESETSTDLESAELSFRQVFAPGVGLVGAIPVENAPLSVGVAWRSLPALREIDVTEDDGTVTTSEVQGLMGLSLFVAVDIPLFP